MKYFIWSLRRKLARLFYKKWFLIIIHDGIISRTPEIDPEKTYIYIKGKTISFRSKKEL